MSVGRASLNGHSSGSPMLYLLCLLLGAISVPAFKNLARPASSSRRFSSSYLDELNVFKTEKKILVGITTDAWNVGQKKYREFLAVSVMLKRLQRAGGCGVVEVPLWEISQGPHFDMLQGMFESFWIPDFTNADHFILDFDLIVVPDPVMGKYMVEAYYEKEAKVYTLFAISLPLYLSTSLHLYLSTSLPLYLSTSLPLLLSYSLPL
ncbi:hypothetical protein B484DRAFT_283890, partial [Ochromonadaceae sp. CCMP2298]